MHPFYLLVVPQTGLLQKQTGCDCKWFPGLWHQEAGTLGSTLTFAYRKDGSFRREKTKSEQRSPWEGEREGFKRADLVRLYSLFKCSLV